MPKRKKKLRRSTLYETNTNVSIWSDSRIKMNSNDLRDLFNENTYKANYDNFD